MIKSILLASFLMAFTFIAMPITSAQACATCGCAGAHAHAEAKKTPCTKCLEAGKPCKCGDKTKKPCEKVLGESKKPCLKCDESEAKFHASKKAKRTENTSGVDHSKKGSFTFKSKSTFSSKGSAKYN